MLFRGWGWGLGETPAYNRLWSMGGCDLTPEEVPPSCVTVACQQPVPVFSFGTMGQQSSAEVLWVQWAERLERLVDSKHS